MKGLSDSTVHGASMGPIWGRQDPDGPLVGPLNVKWTSWRHNSRDLDYLFNSLIRLLTKKT